MPGKRRRFPLEFKAKVALGASRGDQTVHEITATYEYDVLGRRIGKSVVFDPGASNPGVPQGTTRYSLDDRWRILEETNATGTTSAFASRAQKRGAVGSGGDNRQLSHPDFAKRTANEPEGLFGLCFSLCALRLSW